MADLYRVRDVSEATKVYGVLGVSVERSLSPILHNRAFETAGLDAVYVPLQAEALKPFMEAVPHFERSGFSVTRPYKVDILSFLDEVDEAAALCSSVNTVLVHDGVLRGSTTDDQEASRLLARPRRKGYELFRIGRNPTSDRRSGGGLTRSKVVASPRDHCRLGRG